MRRDLIKFTVFFVLSIILIQAILFISLIDSQNNHLAKAEATGGFFSLCLNFPSNISLSDCPLLFNQSTSIEDNSVQCQLNMSHPRGHEVIVEPINSVQGGLSINLDSNGSLFINSSQDSVGTNQFSILAYDVHECSLFTEKMYDFTIIDINDPPHLVNSLPNRVLLAGSELIAFSLDAFFDDVDIMPMWGEPLSYKYYSSGVLNVQIIIDNDSIVRIRSPADFCGIDYVYFEATDQGNLTGDSNVISIDSRCDEDEADDGADEGGLGRPCIPEWRCDPWNDCLINGTQSRECIDVYRCDPDDYKKIFWRECEYLATCFDGVENCHVMLDGSVLCEEGIDCGGPCEPCGLDEDVDEADATCFDGVQNCHVMPDGSILCEEGVDCGGPCEPCERRETPGLFIEESADSIILFTAILVVLTASLLASYIIFRKEIMSFFAKIGWWLTKKKRKQFLLKDADKKLLLDNVNKLYGAVLIFSNPDFVRKDKELIKSIELSRKYLSLALKIPVEFSFEEVKKGASMRIYNESLAQGISLFAESLFVLERKSSQVSKQELLNFVQEIRMLVMNTSKLVKEDFNFKALELDLPKPVFDRAQVLIHNSFLALSFSEAISAQTNYFELLGLYDKMDDVEKNKAYSQLAKVYLYTKTVLSWI